MRPDTRNFIIATFCFVLIPAACLGQVTSPCGVTSIGMIYGPSGKTGAPFSVTIQTTHDQQLGDGNAIHALLVTHGYRDSAGRTRQETSGLCDIGLDGQFHPTITVSIYDPAKRTTVIWQVNGRDKVARIRHQAEQQPQSAASAPQMTAEQKTLNALIQEHWRKNNRSEKLGSRTIAGIACDDSRQITIIPAGEQGNQLPMEMVDELCIAHDTGMSMLHIQGMPLMGLVKAEVTEFSTSEPDSSVFAPPPGYAIEEQPVKTAGAVSGE